MNKELARFLGWDDAVKQVDDFDGDSVSDWKRNLEGRKIVEVKDHIFYLDNDMRLKIEEGGECCAYWNVKSLFYNEKLRDNIITNVELTGEDEGAHVIHILTDAEELARVEVDGDPGTGYYGFSVSVKVEVLDAD